ncbi:MAG: transposase, partial [Rhodobacteraceae bacterium]|nr:transposase [Paracoccaceae bacterium]
PAESSGDALTEVLRQGARNLLPVAIEAAVSEFLRAHEARVDDQGRRRRVRHGHLPERDIMTGIGTVAVRVPKIRDRGMNPDGDRIRFSSRIVPPDLRKTKSVEELIPWLYLK